MCLLFIKVLLALKGFKFSGGGHGIVANYGSMLYECSNIEMTGLLYNGFQIVNKSSAPYCYNINIHNISQTGVYSYLESMISITDLTCQNNTQYGAAVSNGSRIALYGTTSMSGNGSGNYSVTINAVQAPYGDLISVA